MWNLKLLLFFKERSDTKSYLLNPTKLIAFAFLFFISTFLFSATVLYVATNVFQDYKIAGLKHQNAILVAQLETIGKKVDGLSGKIHKLEKTDDDLRMIANLPVVDQGDRDIGFGGTADYLDYSIEDLPVEIGKKTSNLRLDIEKLDRRLLMEKESFELIKKKLRSNLNLIDHTPSIRPVTVGRLKSKFGRRRDPFLGIIRHHEGIDIAAPDGTPVYAPADGVVIAINNSPLARKGYGRYVIIDHGYGYETLYGHLSKIYVRVGQKVKRWDKIAAVGHTGRATGSHLHYEVRVKQRPVDPMAFIYN
ncbi:murein DD-endopeptidase MepM [bacterium BMS3Abin05]|nr:murein DD-endopeptidase MepM [bacterium BMS3Abin05]GBE28628.1 murein DD-endopeptidase MepM [bacterium BMS3Bbin03]HDL78306.1 M23 family metallopeptidase [Bacteroidota bacterium]HDZ11325.1 M23 family metallopeptidase [Bacteroidota bacterium]